MGIDVDTGMGAGTGISVDAGVGHGIGLSMDVGVDAGRVKMGMQEWMPESP